MSHFSVMVVTDSQPDESELTLAVSGSPHRRSGIAGRVFDTRKGNLVQSDGNHGVMPEPSKLAKAATLGEQPFGTSHWAGVWKGYPALSLSYYGGATLFYFDGEWKKEKFDDLASLHAAIGVNR